MKLKIENDGNDGLSFKQKDEIHIFNKAVDLLISSILCNNSFIMIVIYLFGGLFPLL